MTAFTSEAQAAADRIKARREAEATSFGPGDVVRIGRDLKLWTVDHLWTLNGSRLARLEPVDGQLATSVHVTSLVLIEKASSEVES